MTTNKSFIQRTWPYLVVALVTCIAHGFLLLVDWTFWEGAYNIPIIVSRDPARMSLWVEQAVPIAVPYLLLLGSFTDVYFASNLMAFLSFLAIGQFVYAICQNSGLMSRYESLAVAMAAVVYPVFQLAVVNSVTAYIFGFAIYLAGALLFLRAIVAAGPRCWILRGLALVCLLAGMNFLQSLYVYHFGFVLFCFLVLLKSEGIKFFEGLKRFILRRLDLILLPFIGWGIRQTFYPSTSGYNSFVLDLQIIIKNTLNSFNFGLIDPLLVLLTRYWWATFLVFIACALLFQFRPRIPLRIVDELDDSSPHWLWLGFGLVLFVMGFFAYVVVDKGPTRSIFAAIPFDVDTRNTLLLGLPAAIILVAVVRWLTLKKKPVWMALGATLLLVYVAGSAVALTANYIDWQIRAIKDHSFTAQLVEMENAKQYPVLWVHDEFPAGGIQMVEGEGFYAGEELQLIAQSAWPDDGPHSLIDDNYRDYSEQDFVDHNFRYLAPGAGLENCQGELILRRNPDAGSDLDVLGHYYLYKFFRGEEVLNNYLTGNYRLTMVFFKPSETQPVEGCPLE